VVDRVGNSISAETTCIDKSGYVTGIGAGGIGAGVGTGAAGGGAGDD
jgi:hypothetical protein